MELKVEVTFTDPQRHDQTVAVIIQDPPPDAHPANAVAAALTGFFRLGALLDAREDEVIAYPTSSIARLRCEVPRVQVVKAPLPFIVPATK